MIKQETVLQAWKKALHFVRDNAHVFVDDEGRECHEVDNLVVSVKHAADADVPIQWIRAQAEWLYPTDHELKQTLFTTNMQHQERYAYGSRIFSFRGKLNQLDEYIIPLLRKSPNSRRALVVLADPIVDDVTVSRNYVSLLSIWFRIINNKLCVTAVVRSSDVALGWPANMYQTSLLQEYICEKLGIPPGSITTVLLSAHFFSDDAWLLDKLSN